MPKVVFANSACVVGPSSNRVRLAVDDAWYADDPFVQSHPHLFSEVPSKVRGTPAPEPAVEQATAAPGEKRGGLRKSSLTGRADG